MNNILTNIGEALMAVNFAAMLLVLMLKQKTSAFEVVVFATMLLGVGHLVIEYKLHSLSGWGVDRNFVRAAWYLGFSATYLAHVVFCAMYCHVKKLTRDKSSTIILISFFVAAVLQVSRYIDRCIIETDMLGALYSGGIPAINSICTLVIVMYVASKYLTASKLSIYLSSFKMFTPLLRNLSRWTA